MKTSVELQIYISNNFSVELDINSVLKSWLTRTVNSSLKISNDIRSDKSKAVFDFFDFCAKSAEQVLPSDVDKWCWDLKTQGLADGTEKYLGVEQDLIDAPCDHSGLGISG